jgi:hypothetical protein
VGRTAAGAALVFGARYDSARVHAHSSALVPFGKFHSGRAQLTLTV